MDLALSAVLRPILSTAQRAAFSTALIRQGGWTAPRFIPGLESAGVPILVRNHAELAVLSLQLVARVLDHDKVQAALGEVVWLAVRQLYTEQSVLLRV